MDGQLKNSNKEFITIEKDLYESLKTSSNFLLALESAGVDNWSGYDFARELYEEILEEEY